MLNLDETLLINSSYCFQKNIYIRGILYSLCPFSFLEMLRSQAPETDLIQLIPGFFLVLLFLSYLLLVFLSYIFFETVFELDNNRENGTKTIQRFNLIIFIKFSFIFFFSLLFLSLNSIFPLSLDSFESYEQKDLETLWSFEEVLNLEVILTFIVSILSQLPNLTLIILRTESESQILPEFWKDFSFLVFLISGVITPTIDGYTQLSFSFYAISLYLIVINMIEKRLNLKFIGSRSLNF